MTKNLIICCAGDDSNNLLDQWSSHGENCAWDLFIIYYGDNPYVEDKYKSISKYFAKCKGYKYELAVKMLLPDFINNKERYLQYKYIWFPDSDLEISSASTCRLFELAEERGAEIFSPSIGNKLFPERFDPAKTWASWSTLLTKTDAKYRRISHPESMMPGFSAWAWENIFIRSLFMFPLYRVGWGLESVWSALSSSFHLGKKIPNYVFDDVYVLHLKPVGEGSTHIHEIGRHEFGIYRNLYYPIETIVFEEFNY